MSVYAVPQVSGIFFYVREMARLSFEFHGQSDYSESQYEATAGIFSEEVTDALAIVNTASDADFSPEGAEPVLLH